MKLCCTCCWELLNCGNFFSSFLNFSPCGDFILSTTSKLCFLFLFPSLFVDACVNFYSFVHVSLHESFNLLQLLHFYCKIIKVTTQKINQNNYICRIDSKIQNPLFHRENIYILNNYSRKTAGVKFIRKKIIFIIFSM